MKKADRNIATIALVTAFCLLGDSMLYIALPIYWREAGLDGLWQVGVLLAVNRLVRLPLNPFVGWLYQNISLKTGLLFAVIISVVTTIGYGIVSGFIAWLILRALWGLAWSFLRIGGLSVVAFYGEQGKHGEAMGVYNGLHRLGSLVGMLVGGALTPVFGLSWVSISFGVVSATGTILLLAFFKNDEDEKPAERKRTKEFLGKDILLRNPLIMSTGFLITFLVQGVFMATLSSLIVYHYGEEIHIWEIMITAAALSGALQALRWGWEPFLAKKIGRWSDGIYGRLPMFIGSLSVGATSFLLIPFDFHPMAWILIVLIVLVACTALTTLTDALAVDAASSGNRVRFFTYYSVVQDFGAACGPAIGFILLSFHFGYEILYIGCGVLLVGIIFIWMIIPWQNKKSEAKYREV
ncbi:MFS transporter [Salicibibacter kimchii]|uniref:MFS transporter n=1 Tax=Salicibibacter kimchii TaxID=2099786 RepID=A0A345BY91_9BACI|nr:MFS transporter [Salicibibacter kimchii]AXF55922.1 MFS transporter [Salicibibacter kimchii]